MIHNSCNITRWNSLWCLTLVVLSRENVRDCSKRKYKKLIRRWDSKRQLSLRRHRTRTTKYNRLVHKFPPTDRRGYVLELRTQVYQIQWNNVPLRRSRSFKVTEFATNRKLVCHFLLVINSNLYHMLHSYGDIAFKRFRIAIFGYPSTPPPTFPDGGVPLDDLRKIAIERSEMAKVPNGVETLRKFQSPE